MRKYDSLLIHRRRDEWGDIEVVQDEVYRSLHFGSVPRQSSMRLDDPDALALSYTRAMLAPLLLSDALPGKALLLGLGGGSLAKFLLRQLPDCQVDAVELREEVVKVAHGYFHLPEDHPRLTLHVGDAGAFIRRTEQKYDLILVDAYDHKGMSSSVAGLSFFGACEEQLSPDGVLGINLWSGDRLSLFRILDDLRDNFAGQVLQVPVMGKDNVIAVTSRQPVFSHRLKRLKVHAEALQRALEIEFPQLLKTMQKNNRWWSP